LFDKNYIKKFFDHRGFLIRDLASITAAMHFLESKKIPYHFLALSSFDELLKWGDDNIISPELSDVYELYQQTIKKINPGVFEVIYNSEWLSRLPRPNLKKITEKHIENYLKKDIEINMYNQIKGCDWPSFEDYCLRKFENCTDPIKKELKEYKSAEQKYIKTHIKKIKDGFNKKINSAVGMSATAHGDFHPTPAEALEYLNKTFPNWKINDETKKWVDDYTTKILGDDFLEVLFTWKTSNVNLKDRL